MATLITDNWTGANGAAWSQWTSLGTGTYTIQGNTGQMVTPATAFSPTAAVLSSMAAAVDQELLVDVGFGSVAESYIMVAARTDGTMLAGDVLPTNGFYVLMRTALNDVEIGKMTGGVKTILATVAKTYSTTTRINVRVRVIGSTFSARLWNVGVAEPGAWDYTAAVTTPYLTAGRPMVGGNTNGTRTVTFDNLTVTDGAAAGVAISNTGPALASANAAVVTTGTFTPPAGATLVALVAYESPGGATTGYDQALSSSTGLGWTLQARKSTSATSTGGAIPAGTGNTGVEIWTARTPASAATTVTATSPSGSQRSLRVMVMTGAEATLGGDVEVAYVASGAPSVAVTTTRAGSFVLVAAADWQEVGGGTPAATYPTGQQQIDLVNYAGFYTLRNWRTTAAIAGSGAAVTMAQTAPTGQQIPMVAIELRAAAVSVSVTRTTTWNVDASTGPMYYGYGYNGGYSSSTPTPVPVAVVRASTWQTRTAVPVSRATTWSTNAPTATVTDAYTDTYSDTYGVTTIAVGVSRSTTWATQAAVAAIRSTTWATQATSGLSSVAVTRTTSWAARATVEGATRTITWAVLSRVAGVSRATAWQVFSNQSGTTATTVPGARLRVYQWNGADLGPLPTPIDVNVSYPLDDIGALTFNYFKNAPRADLLGQACEIAIEFTPNGGVTWIEPPSSRFVYTSDGSDPLDPSDKLSVTARAYVGWQLSGAVVLPNNLLNNAGKRGFLSSEGSNPGVILKTLLNEAQGRGALTGLVHSSFSTTMDSAGNPWSSALTIYYEPGLPYMTVLQNLADQGFIDFKTQGRSLYVYNAEATMAVDRTTGPAQVALRAGRDLTEAPFRRTFEALANFAYFAGDNAAYEYLNPGAETPYGRREVFISNGSVSDPGTMATLTQAELSQRDAPRTEYTRGLDFARAASLPFWDYGVGDYVWSAVDGTGVSRLRIRQITLSVADGIVSGNVVLNDRFLESDVRARRRIEGITNGAQSGTGTGGPIYVPGEDTVSPGRVLGLAGSSSAYMGPGGFPVAQVSLTWLELETNENGTPFEDFAHYEVYQRPLGEALSQAEFLTTTPTNQIDLSPYVVGSNWIFNVAAVDTDAHRGELSEDRLVGMAQDTVPPQAPSAPVGSSKLGAVWFYWNGNPATGFWPEDFDYVEVHTSTINNFTPDATTLTDRLYGEGSAVVTTATYGVPVFCKLVAVDKNRPTPLKSVASAQGSATPSRLVGSDVDPGAITYEQLGFKDPGNVIGDGSLETDRVRTLLAGRSSAAWTFTQADRFHGDWAATVNGAVESGTNRQLVLMTLAEVQQILPTDKLFCRFAYKGTAGATGAVQLTVQWVDTAGVSTWMTLPSTLHNGTWQQVAGQLTAPANCQDFRIYLELNSLSTSGTFWVDAVEVRRTVATEFIEDAAITRALIQDLAVNDAKIATLSVGKITGGIGSFDMVIAGRLMTATSGSRVLIDGTGIRLFNDAGVTTVEISPALQYLRVNSTQDVNLTSTGHPFQIGLNNGPNMAFDNNEIQARFNGTAANMALNLNGGDVHLSGMLRTRKINNDMAALTSNETDLGLFFDGANNNIRVTNAVNSGTRNIVALAFDQQSSSQLKVKRSDFDPVSIIKGAPAQRWQYRPDISGDDQRWRFGPMADHLPQLRRGEGEDATLSVSDLVGVLWGAVRMLLAERAERGTER